MEKILAAAVALIAFGVILSIMLDDVWRDPALCPYCVAPLTGRPLVCPQCHRALGKR